MPDHAVLHLTRIADAIADIKAFTTSLDQDSFVRDKKTCAAVAMNLQIGEAARNLTESERAEAAEIPWRDIVGLRHRISHDYRTINFILVWRIVEAELDKLALAVARMLTARGE